MPTIKNIFYIRVIKLHSFEYKHNTSPIGKRFNVTKNISPFILNQKLILYVLLI